MKDYAQTIFAAQILCKLGQYLSRRIWRQVWATRDEIISYDESVRTDFKALYRTEIGILHPRGWPLDHNSRILTTNGTKIEKNYTGLSLEQFLLIRRHLYFCESIPSRVVVELVF
jgi:hypothetical protein